MFDTALDDYRESSDSAESRALIDRMCAAGRAQARAAADRLDAIGELFVLRRAQRGECDQWAVDTWAAVGAEVAAALQTSVAMAGSYLRYALAMRERLPAASQGDIDHTIAFADGGATHPSNLKCLCLLHHLMKTCWGWRDKQLPDGTLIWLLPDGHT